MKKETAHDKLKKLNGWSKSLEDALKRTHSDVFSNPSSNGTFKIKKVNDKFFWYYQLSQSGKGRMKYLCSTEPKDIDSNQSSFEYAFDKLKIKLQTQFKIKSNQSHLLHTYILEYVSREARMGGWFFDTTSFKLEKDETIIQKRNAKSIKSKLIYIKGFYEYCKNEDIPISIVPTKGLTTLVRTYLEFTIENGKKKAYLNSEKGESIRRTTAKSYLRNIRFFCDWLVKDTALGGMGMFSYHPFTTDFQIELIKNTYGKYIPVKDKNEMVLFRPKDYEKCVNECVEIVRDKWISVCKSKGDLSVLRRGYYEKSDIQNGVGRFHTNQPANNPIGADIVYFISLLQLRYGFRVGEILNAFRDEDSMIKSEASEYGMRSYFEKDRDDENLYLFTILNSKNRNRIVPIDETIWSFHHKPPHDLGVKVEFETKGGKKDYRWETNIIDVCKYLWPDSYYLFQSPNYKQKPNQPYRSNYYLNIFKNRMVEEESQVIRNRKKGGESIENWNGLGWRNRSIFSSHHLRKYFISYMIRKEGVEPLELSEITGHTIETMLSYYNRLDVESGRKTLLTNRIKNILSKNRISKN